MLSGTPLQRLAGRLLGQPVDDFIITRRTGGMSWQKIADDLHSATGGLIDCSRETLRIWYREDPEEEDSE